LGVAACGGASPTSSPEPSSPSPTVAPAITLVPEPTAAPPGATGTITVKAVCDAVSLRRSPSTTAELVGRVYLGTKVRVVETVSGDAYTVGACGTSGDTWHKIDKIAGKTVQSLYDVPFVYSAAGFFK
jgi:hypothetical protein